MLEYLQDVLGPKAPGASAPGALSEVDGEQEQGFHWFHQFAGKREW